MTRLRNSTFALAVVFGSASYLSALAATAVALLATVPCQWAVISLPDAGVCAASLWAKPTIPWVIMSTGMVFVLVLGTRVVRGGASSWRQTRAVVRALEASAGEASTLLRDAAQAAGVARIREVDVPQYVALCYGGRRPIVLVSTPLVRELAAEELLAVLVHEAAHVSRRDPLRLAVLRCVSGLGAALPAVRHLVAHSVVLAEWTADQDAVRRVGLRAVAAALHHILRERPAVEAERVTAPGFCLSVDRVAYLGHPQPPPIRVGTRSALLSTVSGAVALYVVIAVLRALDSTAGVIAVPLD